jgi:hypothetical protein
MRTRCEQFHFDPTRNPDTGRPIKTGAAIYNRLVRECGPPNVQQPINNLPQQGYNLPQPGYNLPQQGYNLPQQGYNLPQQGYNLPQPGTNLPQPIFNLPQPGTNLPQPIFNLPQPGINLPQPGTNLPQPGINLPRPIVNLPQPGTNLPQPGINLPRPGINLPRPIFNLPQSGINLPQPGINLPQPGINLPQPGTNLPQPGINLPRPTVEQEQLLIEQGIMRKLSNGTMGFERSRNQPIQNYVRIGEPPSVVEIRDLILSRTPSGVSIRDTNIGNYHNYNLIGYLMIYSSPTFIRNLLDSLGFTYIDDDLHVYYCLLWYIYGNADSVDVLDRMELRYISGLSTERLLSIFPPSFRNNFASYKNKASLLYAAMSRRYVLNPNISPQRYQEVTNYLPAAVWRLFSIRYRSTYLYNIHSYTPYDVVAMHPKDAIENIFIIADINNVFELIDMYGVVFPNDLEELDSILQGFLEQISVYDQVFTRNPNTLPPPPISDRDVQLEITNVLSKYSTRELLDAYEVDFVWNDRSDLIRNIAERGRGGAKWSWNHKFCKNDDTHNIYDFTPHGEMNKNDPNDPTLSYGILSNYRCYQVNELVEMFNQYPDEFKVPDVNLNTNIGTDPTTRLPYNDQFPVESMRQLVQLLENPPNRQYNVGTLLNLTRRKLQAYTGIGNEIRRLKQELATFTPEQQSLIRLFLAWIFFYGNWMRFWKGPGNPWPYNTRDDNVCIPASRDEHIFIQNQILNIITEEYAQDPVVANWINRLPTVSYDFNTNEVTLKITSLVREIQKYLAGNACMGFGGDTFLQTGYYLIVNILGLNQPIEFDRFLEEKLPRLLELERGVVLQQLNENGELMKYINDRTQKRERIEDEIQEKYRVLRERAEELNRGRRNLDRFEPTRVRDNRHVYRF